MKKKIIIALSLVMALSLSACGNKDSANKKDNPETTETTEITENKEEKDGKEEEITETETKTEDKKDATTGSEDFNSDSEDEEIYSYLLEQIQTEVTEKLNKSMESGKIEFSEEDFSKIQKNVVEETAKQFSVSKSKVETVLLKHIDELNKQLEQFNQQSN